MAGSGMDGGVPPSSGSGMIGASGGGVGRRDMGRPLISPDRLNDPGLAYIFILV
jgi:hypothetical protein